MLLPLNRIARQALGISWGLLLLASAARGAVPSGFTDALVTAIGSPTALAFTPDGRLLITRQGGELRIFQGGALLPTPALSIGSVCTESERGLLGVAVDPAFPSNGFLYLFYTFRRPDSTCANRVSRFTLSGNTASPASELVLLDNMPSPAGNHNAGDVEFGRDGLLYVTIGDGGCDYAGDSGCAGSNDAARDLHVLTGKVLRITAAGGIPAGNPFQGAGTARCNTGPTAPGTICREIFATGLRNPFRLAFDPNAPGTRFFINDVGQGAWEEIDLGQAGTDYGWNCREGRHVNSTTGRCSPTPAGMIDPIFEYSHGATVPGTSVANCNSITGGAFVPDGLWPGMDGIYLFSDFICGAIFRLAGSGGSFAASDFATGLGGSSAVTLRFGPLGTGQALYYTTYAGGGQVRRIALADVAGNHPPAASLTASPRFGPLPLTVSFDASASADPDPGDTLTYFWDFGDGTPTLETASPIVSHTYTAGINTRATLRVRDAAFAFSAPAGVDLFPGGIPPDPLDFYTVAPCRAADTRRPSGALGGPALAGGATRTFPLAGVCGVPAAARALAVNLTVVSPTAEGHLTAFPGGGPVPQTSTLNFPAGGTRAVGAVLGLGSGGDLGIHAALPPGSSTHLLIDVVGYFQ